MTTHPDHSQDVPMATTADHPADSDSLLASRDPELTARFVNDALPYLNLLSDRARRLTHNAVDADDLMQETMLRAYAGFNTFSEGTNLRAWLSRIMTKTYINGLHRAQHRPSEYLTDQITDRTLATPDRHCPQRPRSGAVRWHCRSSAAWLRRSRLRWGRPSTSLFFARAEFGDLGLSP
jgi:DNA-directed RNA polymerase specialized sigma24 family protein